MGLEISSDYGGSSCNFMTTILAVEELAKVDGAVAALVDIHNTLVNSLIIKVASEEQKAKYLPKLAQEFVSYFHKFISNYFKNNEIYLLFKARKFLSYRTRSWLGCVFIKNRSKKRRGSLYY